MAKRWRAKTGLSYPTDPRIIARIKAGEKLTPEQRKAREVAAGEIVDNIPEGSIGWLLEGGYIELVEEAAGGQV